MFGIGMPELLLILAVALIVIGPKKLPDLARSLGKAMGEFKRATNDLKESIEKDTGIDEVRKSLKDTNQDIRRAFNDTHQGAPTGKSRKSETDPVKKPGVKEVPGESADEPDTAASGPAVGAPTQDAAKTTDKPKENGTP